MIRCPTCSADVPEQSRFCLACGAAIAPSAALAAALAATIGIAPTTTPLSSAIDEGRFPVGTVLAERYRILGLVGQGGMGEVYRDTTSNSGAAAAGAGWARAGAPPSLAISAMIR